MPDDEDTIEDLIDKADYVRDRNGYLIGDKVIAALRAMNAYLQDISDRIEPLEAHKEAADDAAEAATHRPSCKCGYFGHG